MDEKEKGNSCVKEKDYENAIKHYKNALKLLSEKNLDEKSKIFSNISLCRFNQKDTVKSLKWADKSIKATPLWPKGYFRKILVYNFLQKKKEAALVISKLMKKRKDMLSNEFLISQMKKCKYYTHRVIYEKLEVFSLAKYKKIIIIDKLERGHYCSFYLMITSKKTNSFLHSFDGVSVIILDGRYLTLPLLIGKMKLDIIGVSPKTVFLEKSHVIFLECPECPTKESKDNKDCELPLADKFQLFFFNNICLSIRNITFIHRMGKFKFKQHETTIAITTDVDFQIENCVFKCDKEVSAISVMRFNTKFMKDGCIKSMKENFIPYYPNKENLQFIIRNCSFYYTKIVISGGNNKIKRILIEYCKFFKHFSRSITISRTKRFILNHIISKNCSNNKGRAIDIFSCENCIEGVIKNCSIYNSGMRSISIRRSKNIKINNCVLDGVKFRAGCAVGSEWSEYIITNSKLLNCDMGFYITENSSVTIKNCLISKNNCGINIVKNKKGIVKIIRSEIFFSITYLDRFFGNKEIDCKKMESDLHPIIVPIKNCKVKFKIDKDFSRKEIINNAKSERKERKMDKKRYRSSIEKPICDSKKIICLFCQKLEQKQERFKICSRCRVSRYCSKYVSIN